MPSKSKAQHNLMEAVAHDKGFAKKVGIPQKVGKDFANADKGKKMFKAHSHDHHKVDHHSKIDHHPGKTSPHPSNPYEGMDGPGGMSPPQPGAGPAPEASPDQSGPSNMQDMMGG